MKLTKSTIVRLNEAEANFVGHLCYAAGRLWNVGNYERRNWQKLGFAKELH